MIKVRHQDNQNRTFKTPQVNDWIILELVFDDNCFSLYSELQVIEYDEATLFGKAVFVKVRDTERYKTFNDYSAHQGVVIPFKYTDICDVKAYVL